MNQPIKGWDDWAQTMLNRMADNTTTFRDMEDRIAKIEKAQAVAEVKYGFLGAFAGAIAGLASRLVTWGK